MHLRCIQLGELLIHRLETPRLPQELAMVRIY